MTAALWVEDDVLTRDFDWPARDPRAWNIWYCRDCHPAGLPGRVGQDWADSCRDHGRSMWLYRPGWRYQ